MKIHRSILPLCFILAITVVSCIIVVPDDYHLVTRIVDGDTIALNNGDRVRYIGIDTPETVHPDKPVQCYGPEATEFNRELVDGKYVHLQYDEEREDRWGRILAYVYLRDGTFVNAELIRQGYARAAEYPPNTKHSTFLAELEREAREAERGLWGECMDEGAEVDDETITEEGAGVVTSDCVGIGYILADAPGREPDGEIIELENNCGSAVDIGGWRLSDGEGSYRIPDGETIDPHGTWRVYGRQYNPTRYTRGLFLNNRSDCVYLYDKSGILVNHECW